MSNQGSREERRGKRVWGSRQEIYPHKGVSLILGLTTSFSGKTGLSLGLATTSVHQAAQHQWSRGGALPAQGHILCCKWVNLPGGLSRSEGNNKRISQLAYQIPAKPHSQGAQGTFLTSYMSQPILPHTLGKPGVPIGSTSACQVPISPQFHRSY